MEDNKTKLQEMFEDLILDALTGQLDKEKKERLGVLLEDKDNARIFKNRFYQYKTIGEAEKWHKLDERVAKKNVFLRLKARRRMRTVLGYAASLLFLVGGSYLLFSKYLIQISPRDMDETVLSQNHVPAKAILIVDGEEKVSLYSNTDTVIATSGQSQVLVRSGQSIQYVSEDKAEEVHSKIHTLQVPHGSEFCVTLSDGTKVWLNAESSLTYPEYFSGNIREVKLSGEAYFEVIKDTTAPFEVLTSDSRLRVLGTSFNVKSYPDDNKQITTLITGKVRESYLGVTEMVTLLPSQQVVYNRESHTYRVAIVNTREALAWKNGKIIMKNWRLEDIFRELARWYTFDVTYQSKDLKDMIFHLNVDRYDDIEMVLEKLERTKGVKFTIKDSHVTVCK